MSRGHGLILACFCLLFMTGCSFQPSHEAADVELIKIQSDQSMVVSEWYRQGYFVGGNFVLNSICLKMLGVHAVLWIGMTIYIERRLRRANRLRLHDHPVARLLFHYLLGYLFLATVCLLFWWSGGILVSIWSPNRHLPFDFACFLALAAIYAAVAAYVAVLLINKVRGRPQPTLAIAPSGPVTSRSGRMVRAMLKAAFVALASGIGGQIGGWIGGTLVFVISVGVSAFFGIPAPQIHH